MIKKIICSTASLLIFGAHFCSCALAQSSESNETLSYELSYSGIKIADIIFSESGFYAYDGDNVKDLECEIISSSDFLNIGGKYRSVISEDNSVKYYREQRQNRSEGRIIEYWFNYDKNKIKVLDSRIVGADTTGRYFYMDNANEDYFDSISLIFRLRSSYDTLTTPAYYPYFEGSRTDTVTIESINRDSLQLSDNKMSPVNIITGRVKAGLIPGSRETFKIYLTTDEASVPVYGRLYMALGYIEMKLVSGY
jgi:hypothetical protein